MRPRFCFAHLVPPLAVADFKAVQWGARVRNAVRAVTRKGGRKWKRKVRLERGGRIKIPPGVLKSMLCGALFNRAETWCSQRARFSEAAYLSG